MREPEAWSLERLLSEDLGATVVWTTPSVRARSVARLPFPHRPPLTDPEREIRTLVVVGGGTLIDQAKVWRRERMPALRLIAIASLWGSGSEASPVAVLNREGRKVIDIDPAYVPDIRVSWPELAETVAPIQARRACGDAWAHALEGFLSPLATVELRREAALLLSSMLDLPVGIDPRWFEASVAACRIQAQSGVGLVHGIAHTLEGPLAAAQPDFGWGHAALCATFLWPVMSLNSVLSAKAEDLLREHGLDPGRMLERARSVFEAEAYDRALPLLESNWHAVLRDPCTRTNSVLVRPGHLEHFRLRAFAA